ncbi:MAG: thioredoxin fold domain-containing protein [Thermoguttaceae bacterium]
MRDRTRNFLRMLYVLGLVLVLAGALSIAALAQGPGVAWTARLDEAQVLAQNSGKLVLVHFYGDHCGPCKRMDSEVFPMRGVVEAISRDYIPVKIDSTQAPELVQRFGIRGIPADVILSSDGRIVHKREGGITAERYTEYLNLVARRNQPQNVAPPVTPQVMSPQVAATPVDVLAPPTPPFASQHSSPLLPNYDSRPSVTPSSVSPWGEPVVFAPEPEKPSHKPDVPVEAVKDAPALAPVDVAVKTAEMPSRPMVEIPLALDGFCPVTLRTSEKWTAGNPLFYHLYHGQIYRFVDASALEKFRVAPDEYAPVADGNDIVIFVERQRMVPGVRRFGVWYDGRVFLFSSRESLETFAKKPQFFAEIAGRYEASVGENLVR